MDGTYRQGRLVVGAGSLERAGDFSIEAEDRGLFYLCPCGCGAEGYLDFRSAENPQHPSWKWDGNREAPTLSPSILRTSGCRWHGYLRDGWWRSC